MLPPVIWKGNLVDLSGSDSDGEIGRSGEVIRGIVHHRIVGSIESTINEFTDASASGQRRRVSSHFGIGYIGPQLVIVQFVALENTAYCNGQSASDREACRWRPWIADGRPPANRITVSIEHEDNGSAGRYVVKEPIIAASIELDRLLLAGDGPAIRRAGIRCTDAAAKQLRAIVPSSDTLIDHHVVSPISKPYCWRAIGDDPGFPRARYVTSLADKEAPMLGFKIVEAVGGVSTVKGDARHSLIRLRDGRPIEVPAGEQRQVVAKVSLLEPYDANPGDRRNGWLIGGRLLDGVLEPNIEVAFMLASDVVFEPTPAIDCGGDIAQARLDVAERAQVIAATAALEIRKLGDDL